MKTNETKSSPVSMLKQDEKILVVAKEKLFHGADLTGFQPLQSFAEYQCIIEMHKEFLWRSKMEVDPAYKQICPYLIFNYKDKFFLMQRKNSASEQRLKNKYTFGIGGHIREEDITGKDMEAWADREFNEEISYSGTYTMKALGLINDESNPVGHVHTGFAFLLQGTSDDIEIRSELKHGQLLTLKECESYFNDMEPWSQLIFDFLKNMNI